MSKITDYLKQNPDLSEALKNYYENQEGGNKSRKKNSEISGAVSIAAILFSLLFLNACEQPDGSKPDTETNIPVVPDPNPSDPDGPEDPEDPDIPVDATVDATINGTAIGEDGTISIDFNGNLSVLRTGAITGVSDKNWTITVNPGTHSKISIELIKNAYIALDALTNGTVTLNVTSGLNYTASSSAELQALSAGTIATGLNVKEEDKALAYDGAVIKKKIVTVSEGKTLTLENEIEIPILQLQLIGDGGVVTAQDWDKLSFTGKVTNHDYTFVLVSDVIESKEGLTGTLDNPVTPKWNLRLRSDDMTNGQNITALYELIKKYPVGAATSHFSALQLSGRFYIDGSNAGSPNSETSFEDLERASRILNDVRNYTVTDLPTSNIVDGDTVTELSYAFTNAKFKEALDKFSLIGALQGYIEFDKDSPRRASSVQKDTVLVFNTLSKPITIGGSLNFHVDVSKVSGPWTKTNLVVNTTIPKFYVKDPAQQQAFEDVLTNGYHVGGFIIGSANKDEYIAYGNAANVTNSFSSAKGERRALDNARNEIMPNGRQGFANLNNSSYTESPDTKWHGFDAITEAVFQKKRENII